MEDEAPQAAPLPGSWRSHAGCFLAAFFVLQVFPYPFSAIPWQWLGHEALPEGWRDAVTKAAAWVSGSIVQPCLEAQQSAVRWAAAGLFRVEAPLNRTGSGDAMWSFVKLACTAGAALVVALPLACVPWGRSWRWLEALLRAQARMVLALALLSYGAYKAIPSQMPLPDLDRLAQPFGEASPMGLLWTFLGANPAYERFSGLAEIAGGVLLLQRRTATLGALVGGGVMLNVVAFNFFYDVPVKLYSSWLLALAAWVAWPDAAMLARMLVLRGGGARLRFERLIPWGPGHWAAIAARYVVAASTLVTTLGVAGQYHESTLAGAAFSPRRGIWAVTRFELDGRPCDGLAGEPMCWRRMIVSYAGRLALERAGDPWERYGSGWDEEKRTLVLTHADDKASRAELRFEQPALDRLVLEGDFAGRAIRVELALEPPRRWLLLERGFQWITEFPFNR